MLNRGDLLLSLLESIDVEAEVLVILNRIGPADASVRECLDRVCSKPPAHVRVSVDDVDGNLGVAGSWNRIIDHWGGDCVVANSDIVFTPGILTRALQAIVANPEVVLQHLHAAACFYASPRFTSTLGWFDENIYPAYCEDQEMALRSRSLGVRRCNVPKLGKATILHGGSATVRNADRQQRAFLSRATGFNRQYLGRRWGALPSRMLKGRRFPSPFDDPTRHPADWTLDFTRREQIAAACLSLTGHVCPLRYHRRSGGLEQSESAALEQRVA